MNTDSPNTAPKEKRKSPNIETSKTLKIEISNMSISLQGHRSGYCQVTCHDHQISYMLIRSEGSEGMERVFEKQSSG